MIGPVVHEPPPTNYVKDIGRRRCCCCEGCCQVGFGVTLGAGLSALWAFLAASVAFGGIDYVLFSFLFNQLFLVPWGVTCVVAFVATLCTSKFWWICCPYLILTSVYCILLAVDGFISLDIVINAEEPVQLGEHIGWVINIPMAVIQLWNVIYASHIVYHMFKFKRAFVASKAAHKVTTAQAVAAHRPTAASVPMPALPPPRPPPPLPPPPVAPASQPAAAKSKPRTSNATKVEEPGQEKDEVLDATNPFA